jgi:hypothetical protein
MNYEYTGGFFAPNTNRLDYNRCGNPMLFEADLNEAKGIPKQIRPGCGPNWETFYGPDPNIVFNTDGSHVTSNMPLSLARYVLLVTIQRLHYNWLAKQATTTAGLYSTIR